MRINNKVGETHSNLKRIYKQKRIFILVCGLKDFKNLRSISPIFTIIISPIKGYTRYSLILYIYWYTSGLVVPGSFGSETPPFTQSRSAKIG